MKTFFRKFIIFTIVLVSIISCISPIAQAVPAQNDVFKEYFKGKTISILGDSISTYVNKSNGAAASTTNSTIKNYPCHYKNGVSNVSLNDTWWVQAAATLGAEILVNNSYSTSRVFDHEYKSNSAAYISRAENLHDNTGDNAGEKPDIIAIYLGVNDVALSRSYLGNAENINYYKLIKENGVNVTYAKPKTTFEAYAIMLHKIKKNYPEAEIYCFNVLPKYTNSTATKDAINLFNSNLDDVCRYFDCNIVDVFNDSGITSDGNNYNRYIHDDKVHPSKKGMSAICSAFLKSVYENSKYIPAEIKKQNVSYNLKNTIVNEGTLKTVLRGDDFRCSFSRLVYGDYDVTVLMNNNEITDTCYNDGKIYIPKVTGNIKISAKLKYVQRSYNNYRFEVENNNLISLGENENTYNPYYVYNKGAYVLNDKFKLNYDENWSVVLRLKNNTTENIDVLDSGKESDLALTFDVKNKIIGFKSKSSNAIYGIDLNTVDVSFTDKHTYKITNEYDEMHGKNIFTLYVDGYSVGSFENYYDLNGNKSDTVFDIDDTDLIFSQIGTAENPIKLNTIEYLQVWESDDFKNHIHNFDYPVQIKATCSVPRTIVTLCDCGEVHKEYSGKTIAHTKSKWITTKKATANAKGKAIIKCTVCNKTLDTKTLKQLKCSTPKLTSAQNTVSGIKISWKKTYGADSYRVYRKKSGGSWEYIARCKSTAYTDTKINNKNGTTYYYTVKAVNEAGNSSHESGLKIKRLITPSLKSAKNASQGIKFTFTSVKGADYYRIYRKAPGEGWEFIATTTKTTYYDKDVKNSYGKKYTYTARAVDGKTLSSYRSGISVTRKR